MATPPTFVADYSTGFAVGASPKTVSVTVSVSDVLAVMAGSEDVSFSLSTPSGGGLAYTLQQSVTVANFGTAYGWTAPSSSSQTFTLSTALGGGGSHAYGVDALRFSGSDGVGASAKTNVTSGAPSLDITTTQDNSAICVVITDWNANDGSTRTWRTVNGITPSVGNGYERVYFLDAARYTAYVAYYPDAGTAGTKTVGMTAPTGQKYSIVAVEIKGTASSTAVWLPQPARRRPPALRILPSTARTWTPVRAQLNPPIPVQEIVQARRLRGLRLRRGAAWAPVPPQFNPPFPFQPIVQPRRLRGIPTRRGRSVGPVPAQVAVTAPSLPFIELVQSRRLRGLVPRRSKGFTVPLVGATPPANPVLPLGPARRPARLLATIRRSRPATLPAVDARPPVLLERRRPGPPGQRRRLAAAPVQPQSGPVAPVRRDRPDLPAPRRGKTSRPIGVQVAPAAPAWVPAVSRIRQWRPFRRLSRMWGFLFPGADHVCTVERPDTGTTLRPSTGTVARPGSGFTARLDTGVVDRPDTGNVPFEC